MSVSEPVTLLTDYMLAGLGAYFALRLFRAAALEQQTSVWLWGVALAAMAAAALFGGTYHGFTLGITPHLGEAARAALWKGTVYSLGLASLAMLSGTIYAAVPRPLRTWLLALAVAHFVAYAVWMITHDEFRYVIYYYGPAMALVLVLEIVAARQRGAPGAGWLIAGVLVSYAAAGIQLSRFALHRHFNHNDLYHVVQMGALYLLFRGAALLRDT